MRNLFIIPLLFATFCACTTDKDKGNDGPGKNPDKDKFSVAITTLPSSNSVAVTAVPTDKDEEYVLFVVEVPNYDAANTPSDAVTATGDHTEMFDQLVRKTDYYVVVDAPLAGYRQTHKFTTTETPEQLGSGETDGYKLVWQDLFDAEQLDQTVWNMEVNGDGGGNAELQYYRAENVSMGTEPASGRHCLTLTARKESFQGKSFTSGRVNTKEKKVFKHGKIEASIYFPKTANGLWPAFWMMGNDYQEVGWPRCGEIDIVEMGNGNGISAQSQDRYFNGACHWGYYKNNAYPNYAKASTWAYSLQDGFHLFTLIWDEENFKMYVDLDKYPDAEPYYQMGISEASVTDDWSTGMYFHKDCFILFNMAVGGRFTGILQPNSITALSDANPEMKMYVDYIKVFQKPQE